MPSEERSCPLWLSGGAKGSFQFGAIKYLLEKGYEFDIVSGVSVGALNGTLLAQGEPDTLENIWLSLKSNDDIYLSRGSIVGLLLGNDSLYNQQPLWELIKKNVNQQKIIELGKTLMVGYVCLYDGQYYKGIPTDSTFKQEVLASASIPGYFKLVNVNSNRPSCADGGVRNLTPLKDVIDEGAEKIIVINCSRSEMGLAKKKYLEGAKDIVLRTLEVIGNEMLQNDMQVCLDKNELVQYPMITSSGQKIESIPSGYRYIDLILIEPEGSLGIGTLEFDSVKIRKAIKTGYQRAKQVIEGKV